MPIMSGSNAALTAAALVAGGATALIGPGTFLDGPTQQSIYAAEVLREGEPLTVTRPSATQGGTPSTKTVYFVPVSLRIKQRGRPTHWNGEAGYNVSEADSYVFLTDGSQDVRVGDVIGPYRNFLWKVGDAPFETYAGVIIKLHCFTLRTTAV
jgi:hypothetical protein